jgi:acetolactate synthase-1/2/3 large subunit
VPLRDWLQITGGAIGHGFPCATGAALACPGRKVVCLEQMAPACIRCRHYGRRRVKLDVINVVFANRIYKILHGELLAVGQPAACPTSCSTLPPALDWTKLAAGVGARVRASGNSRASLDAFKAAAGRRGPFLIEFQIQ